MHTHDTSMHPTPRLFQRKFVLAAVVCCLGIVLSIALGLRGSSSQNKGDPPTAEQPKPTGDAREKAIAEVRRHAEVPKTSSKSVNAVIAPKDKDDRAERIYQEGMLLVHPGEGKVPDYEHAKNLFLEAASLGNTSAMLMLGRFAEKGLGGDVSGDDARDWFLNAAKHGDGDGFAEAARLYMEGRVLPADQKMADNYIYEGLAAGSAKAQFLKAVSLLDSNGDPASALRYLSNALAENQPDAARLLSRIYRDGRIVPADYAKAVEYAQMAVDLGAEGASSDLANLLLRKLTTNGSTDATKAVDLLYSAADQGSANAALTIALLSVGHEQVDASQVVAAREWALSAFARGETSGAFAVAATYIAAGDTASAKEWLDKGVASSDWRSAYAKKLLARGTAPADVLGIIAKSNIADYQAFSAAQYNKTSTGPTKAPVPLKMTMPVYPTGLASLDSSGAVLAEFVVNQNGVPQGIQILNASHESLASAVTAAVEQWRYKPATRNGQPISVRVRMPIQFASNK